MNHHHLPALYWFACLAAACLIAAVVIRLSRPVRRYKWNALKGDWDEL